MKRAVAAQENPGAWEKLMNWEREIINARSTFGRERDLLGMTAWIPADPPNTIFGQPIVDGHEAPGNVIVGKFEDLGKS